MIVKSRYTGFMSNAESYLVIKPLLSRSQAQVGNAYPQALLDVKVGAWKQDILCFHN
jgi:hypothetical protein